MPLFGAMPTAGLLTEDSTIWPHLLILILALGAWRWLTARKPVYLVDLHCFQPPERLRVNNAVHNEDSRRCGIWTKDAMDFSMQLIDSSGVQDRCYISEACKRVVHDTSKITLIDCLEESRMVLFDCVGNLLAKTGVQPKQIDVVIVSCSCFAPTPSMAAMIVNHFKCRDNVLTYNLSGMGCSSSVICLDLARSLLNANRGMRIVIVNHENVSANLYRGQQREMLVPNCLFRLGGAAVLLTNRRQDAWRAKYSLQHVVRIHMGASDAAFNVIGSKEDEKRNPGIFLSPDVRGIAVQALKRNLIALGRVALPLWMQLKFLYDRKTPSFSRAFQHILPHTGSRGVLDAMGQAPLSLTPAQLEPARTTLAKYELAWLEHQGRIKRGNRIWQLVFGSGFKCNSAVWVARRSVKQAHSCWEYM